MIQRQEVVDGLFIADIDQVRHQSLDVDLVVSVCQDKTEDNVSLPYDQFPLADDEEAVKHWGGTVEYETFAQACERVLQALRDGEEVVVHCHAGQNRSAAICAAVAAVREGVEFKEGFELVRDVRPIANSTRLMEQHAKQFVRES